MMIKTFMIGENINYIASRKALLFQLQLIKKKKKKINQLSDDINWNQ